MAPVWWGSGGTRLHGPREWGATLLEVVDVAFGDMGQVEVRCNGKPLKLSGQLFDGKLRLVATWSRPNTGHHRFVVTTPAGEQRFEVTVRSHKLPGDEVETLVGELETRLPMSIAHGLRDTGALAGLELVTPDEQTLRSELNRLKVAVHGDGQRKGLAELLPRIAEAPHHVLAQEEIWVRRGRARQPSPSRIAAALTTAGNLAEDRRLERLWDARPELSYDVHENQLVKRFALEVLTRLRQLGRLKIGRHGYVVGQAKGLGNELSRVVRYARFLEQVTVPSTPSTTLTMVLLRKPDYRATLEAYTAFRKTRKVWIRFDEPALDSPLDNLPALYQKWCTLHVVDAVLDVAKEAGFRTTSQALVTARGDGYLVKVLPDGRALLSMKHADGRRLTLHSEASFRSGDDGLRSMSYDQRPDLVVRLDPPDRGRPRLLVLDPKYKLRSEDGADHHTEPQKTDIDKMHTYRDAIRWNEHRVVELAYILYPGAPHRQEGVGAVSMRPNGVSGLREVLGRWVAPDGVWR